MSKVLIVATTSYAGMGPYVTSIYNSFLATDNIYFLGREYGEEYFRNNIKSELLSMCTFYKKENTHWNTLKELFFSDRLFDKLVFEICKTYSIKVVHYINRPVPSAIIQSLHNQGIRTIGTIHDLHPHEVNKVWYKMFRYWKGARNLRRDVRLSDNIVTNSLVQLKELRMKYLDKNFRYFSFPSLVTDTIINGRLIPSELKSINKPYILFFGLIEEYKGIDILFNAYASSVDIQNKYNVVIAGRGDIKEEWKQNNGVYFINRFIKDEEVRSLYENASMVVYPYISATQSGVLSLAFYFGIATIVSDVPFFKSIVEPSGTCIMFKAGNVNSLLNAIVKIDSDKKRIIAAEREYYKKYYDNNSLRESLIDVYKSI